MSSHAQFRGEQHFDIPNASIAGKARLYRHISGVWYEKNDVGTSSPISGGFAEWTVTAVQTGVSYPVVGIWETVRVDPTTQPGGIAINLITAIGSTGQQIKVKNVSASVNPINVTPFGGEQIEDAGGGTPWVMVSPREFVVLESDGANWMVVG